MGVPKSHQDYFLNHDDRLIALSKAYKVWAIKNRTGIKVLFIKHLQFSSNQADVQPKSPIHGLVILVRYQIAWKKIVDFSLIGYFWASPIFHCSYFIIASYHKTRLSYQSANFVNHHVWVLCSRGIYRIRRRALLTSTGDIGVRLLFIRLAVTG